MSLKIKKQPFNSILIQADSQEELGNTFIRFQEYYESPNPKFRNNIFTLGQIKNWYSQKYGADTYSKDWTGFNFPSIVLKPFRDGLFDPLTEEEKNFLNLIKYRNDDFYIIAAQNEETIRHELSHALYSYSVQYKKSVDQLCTKYQNDLKKISSYLLNKGYHKSVINDELQAYITDNDNDFIKENLSFLIIEKFIKLNKKYI